MTARERFPVYASLLDRVGRWPDRRTYREQKQLVSTLVTTLFAVWDEKEELLVMLAEVERDPRSAAARSLSTSAQRSIQRLVDGMVSEIDQRMEAVEEAIAWDRECELETNAKEATK